MQTEQFNHSTQVKRIGKQNILEQKRYGNMEYLSFPSIEALGIVKHLFTTRVGGVSKGIFQTMNLSYARGDRKEAVDENFARVAEAMGRKSSDFVCSDQTHTVNIRRVTAADKGKGVTIERDYSDIDGLITNEPRIVLSTFYADCVPLYLVDPVHHAIGLAHSGWKGTAGRMGACMLRAMQEAYNTNPQEVTVAIGPSVCRTCYEVDQDVADRFCETFTDSSIQNEILTVKDKQKYDLDLWKANYYIFLQAGVPHNQIAVTDICTCCNPDYLFSHRASCGKRGNLGAFLSLD